MREHAQPMLSVFPWKLYRIDSYPVATTPDQMCYVTSRVYEMLHSMEPDIPGLGSVTMAREPMDAVSVCGESIPNWQPTRLFGAT